MNGRKNKIYNELLRNGQTTRKNGNWSFDLSMKNGDELRIYLPGEPITNDHNTKDYSLLTDNDEVLHFNTLSCVAEYIDCKY